jgi:lipopolysaccharide export system protein LptA
MFMKRNRMAGLRAAAAIAALLLLTLEGFAAAEAGGATGTMSYSGDSLVTAFAEEGKRLLLTGNARIQTEDVVIRADRIEVYGTDLRYALCAGNVRVVDAKRGIDLTSQQLFYDRQQKISRITGNAVMSDLKNELVVKGGFIEDRNEEKLTIIQIGVRILKKNLVCRAEFARYYREKNSLELSGMPWVTRDGDEYRAGRITVNLDTEEIALEVDVKGEINTEEKAGKEETEPAPEDAGAVPPQTPPAPKEGDDGGE